MSNASRKFKTAHCRKSGSISVSSSGLFRAPLRQTGLIYYPQSILSPISITDSRLGDCCRDLL
jgi:hypothetical protein